MQLAVAGSRATNDQKTLYKNKFETFGKELTKAREKLLKADATNAEDCMHEGKTVQDKIKDAKGEVKLLHKLATCSGNISRAAARWQLGAFLGRLPSGSAL